MDSFASDAFAHLRELPLIKSALTLLEDLKEVSGDFSLSVEVLRIHFGEEWGTVLKWLNCQHVECDAGGKNHVTIKKVSGLKYARARKHLQQVVNGIYWGSSFEMVEGKGRGYRVNSASQLRGGSTGKNLFVGRALIEGGMQIGTAVVEPESLCLIGYGGKTRAVQSFQVLSIAPWSQLSIVLKYNTKGTIPSDAISGGNEADSTTLYPCIVDQPETWIGKIKHGFDGCHIGYKNGHEITVSNYRTLHLSTDPGTSISESLSLLDCEMEKDFDKHSFYDTVDQFLRREWNAETHGGPTAVKRKEGPKRILCHDMKGGYCQDADEKYRNQFTSWDKIDVFCYFSHHFVTIPPRVWIDDCAKNAKVCLGTLITEGNLGMRNCERILQNPSDFAEKLAQLCTEFGFHGWLVNFESPVLSCDLTARFLSELSNACREKVGEASMVLYYDSLDSYGRVNYQNSLNGQNEAFFNSCDGIFLNYWWTEDKILSSIDRAKSRRNDVFFGVDIFARGVRYGPGKGASIPVSFLSQIGASIALFAPGWVLECGEAKNKSEREAMIADREFWENLFSN